MVESIESFVAKLQTEGVQAGHEAARKIREEAERQAAEILANARKEAEAIVSGAQKQAKQHAAQAKSEIDLAARDTVLQLRETLGRLLTAVLSQKARAQLGDAEFLKGVLHDLVLAYAQQDCQAGTEIRLKVSPELKSQLTGWALGEMGHGVSGASHVRVDLKTTLREAGFEYSTNGATIEVTTDSVTALLADIVGPELREVLSKVSAEGRK
jgi:V/A-type H+-transporting ATPase subunit E